MRKIISLLLLIAALGVSTGCHSGTVRGAGSDVEKVGQKMQK